MAAAVMSNGDPTINQTPEYTNLHESDPFVDQPISAPSFSSQGHRPAHLNPEPSDEHMGASPGRVRRVLEAHMHENERRLQETQKLGTSLLRQQDELSEKLKELDQRQQEAEVPTELRQRLAQLEKEHEDVGREVARALLPKSRQVSAEEKPIPESSVYSSHASASPTKVTAPSRRQRNQSSNRAGDLQFAADISTSLLAQVRQLQAAVAERDEQLKTAHTEQSRHEQDLAGLSHRLRSLDENEQRYKDENWNLETQNHQLSAAAREAGEREKRLNATLVTTTSDRARLQSEIDELRQTHAKLSDDHATAKKLHDTEIHSLKRTMDQGDTEKASLQSRVDELTSQNQELALAMSARFRGRDAEAERDLGHERDEELQDLSTPEHSPPPSPTKATPRHPGLESETLRSSLHHAHRMIQNLKNNIHREKTEKMELKRMLQDTRDELEQSRGPSSGNKRQKTKDSLRKSAQPHMLGGNRKARTDVELEEEDWEDHEASTPSHGRRIMSVPGAFNQVNTDASDAYQTTDAEGAFETADEKHGTESEAFQTGEESMAGESTDDLTETEDSGVRATRQGTVRAAKPSLAFKNAGDRTSFMSTASTSAGEEDDGTQTPIGGQNFQRFRLRNGQQSTRQSQLQDNDTPLSQRTASVIANSSPATALSDRSPPQGEQTLFDQLGDMDEMGSERYDTPARDSIASTRSTPHPTFTPSKREISVFKPSNAAVPTMVDAATMTDAGESQTQPAPSALISSGALAGAAVTSAAVPTPADFPLPPSLPQSPVRKTDTSTQYTPQRSLHASPARSVAQFITPPKTVWDEAQEAEIVSPDGHSTPGQTPSKNLQYSGVSQQDTAPISPPQPSMTNIQRKPLNYSTIAAVHTEPITPKTSPTSVAAANASSPTQDRSRSTTAEKVGTGVAAGGLLASAAAAIGLSRSKEPPKPIIAEDETNEPHSTVREGSQNQQPLSAISENSAGRTPSRLEVLPGSDNLAKVSSNDQGSQTALTADQIEAALLPKTEVTQPNSINAPRIITAATDSAPSTPVTSPIKRPSSGSSHRSSVLFAQQHPPLPADHKTAIEKAGGKVPSRDSGSAQPVVMGPPTMPASAMRRPRTPAESSVRTTSKDGVVKGSNVSRHTRTGTQTSQISRRSSVSSFASELDERFNIRPDAQAASHGFEAAPGTDPRMIQAITQTMIGEFLWKYTRKAGRSEMSDTRHRRYFWVHPYTKTLYWSDQDPQTAGRNELKAKSVAIESVRVLTDDNPMPPGLHRKSLEVITPGRRVRFTASTGQRHETWFNALSYLLLRGENDPSNATYAAGGNEITQDDVNEFNVTGAGYGARLVPTGSRVSMSSYNSRTTRGTSTNRNSQRQSLPPGIGINTSTVRNSVQPQGASTPTASSRLSRADQPREAEKNGTLRAGSLSRLSRMIGSVTGRTSRSMSRMETGKERETNSIYDASVVSDNRRDSAEEMRQEMLKQEREGLGGQLEDVRACCDGKSTPD